MQTDKNYALSYVMDLHILHLSDKNYALSYLTNLHILHVK